MILARGLNAEVRSVSREEAGAAGTAMMAAMQQKLFPDMAARAKAWVDPHLGASICPDGQLNGCHDKLFPHFVAARKAMRPTWQGLRETGLA